MSRKDDEVHIDLGREHAMCGLPRYKYQDSRLQGLYDKGYNSFQDEPSAVAHCRGCGRDIKPGPFTYCSRCRF